MTFINNHAPLPHPADHLASHPMLQGLPTPVLEQLCARAQPRSYAPGAVVFQEGDAAPHWFVVTQGCVEIVRFSHDGQERVFHCFHAGQCVAEAAMFMPHGRYPMQARAHVATTAWRLERPALHAACRMYPDLALRLLADFSCRLYRYINEVEWLTTSTAPQRLAACLVQLCADQGACVALPFSQRQMAARLGIRAETLSRLLSDWQSRQWICGQRRSWTLLNKPELEQLARAGLRTF